jgi:hypothetical protein
LNRGRRPQPARHAGARRPGKARLELQLLNRGRRVWYERIAASLEA